MFNVPANFTVTIDVSDYKPDGETLSCVKEVDINLYSPITLKQDEINEKKKKNNTTKNISGILKSFDENNITLEIESNEEIKIERKNISNIKIKFNW